LKSAYKPLSQGLVLVSLIPLGGNDVGVELILPVTQITREERMKIAELAAEIEEAFDVYIGTIVKALA
jgi:hypothetical protein